MKKNPAPPQIGDVFTGPFIGHGVPKVDMRPGRYFVRAIVDAEPDQEYGWFYYVVLCFWTRHKGWRYIIENAHAFGFEQYRRINKSRRPPKSKDSVRAVAQQPTV